MPYADPEARREYAREYARRYRQRPEVKERERQRARRQQYPRKYGISFEQYNEILERQGGVCAACGREETRTQAGVVCGLSVDHDHETGRVRGLLCNACNCALGHVEDDPDRLLALILYLRVPPVTVQPT